MIQVIIWENSCPFNGLTVILKPTLMDHFQCSKKKVDEARSLHQISEGIQLPKNKLICRACFDTVKCEHFLDFIFHNSLLQDVTYRIKNLKYSTGETQTIPHAVITASFKHIILFYSQCCQENQFIPLSPGISEYQEFRGTWW